ncbi:MAG: peroxiredoxin family protein [Acidobacteriota bacterium]
MKRVVKLYSVLPAALVVMASLAVAATPDVGGKAPDFALATVEGKKLRLSDVTAKSPVVLVVLRGYPGYQCPYCNLQAQDFIKNAQGFATAGVRVVMIYPGPPQDLASKVNEFLSNKQFPSSFDLLLDPGYEFTNLYDLRWNEPKETAYPSTFLIDRKGMIFFRKLSKEHAGRTTAAEIMEALNKRK